MATAKVFESYPEIVVEISRSGLRGRRCRFPTGIKLEAE